MLPWLLFSLFYFFILPVRARFPEHRKACKNSAKQGNEKIVELILDEKGGILLAQGSCDTLNKFFIEAEFVNAQQVVAASAQISLGREHIQSYLNQHKLASNWETNLRCIRMLLKLLLLLHVRTFFVAQSSY